MAPSQSLPITPSTTTASDTTPKHQARCRSHTCEVVSTSQRVNKRSNQVPTHPPPTTSPLSYCKAPSTVARTTLHTQKNASDLVTDYIDCRWTIAPRTRELVLRERPAAARNLNKDGEKSLARPTTMPSSPISSLLLFRRTTSPPPCS